MHPKTPEEYRRWWAENTNQPYGLCWCGCGQKTGEAPVSHARHGHVGGEPVRYVSGHNGRKSERAREIRRLHSEGMAKKAIARRLGVPAVTVRRALV